MMGRAGLALGALMLALAGCSRASVVAGGQCGVPECQDRRGVDGEARGGSKTSVGPIGDRSGNSLPSSRMLSPGSVPATMPATEPPLNLNPFPECGGRITFDSDLLVVEAGPTLLIAFDRSSSMAALWESTPRWRVARDALHRAIVPVADLFQETGTVLFPSMEPSATDDDAGLGDGCGVASTLGTGPQLVMTLAGDARTSSHRPSGSTTKPLLDALWELDGLVTEGEGTTVVVLLSGGVACGWDENEALDLVADWRRRGARTHFLALPGVSSEGGRRLDRLAAAGGTSMRVVASERAGLAGMVARIIQDGIDRAGPICLFELSARVEVPEALRVVAQFSETTEVEVHRDSWSLEADNRRVRLVGPVCHDLLAQMDTDLVVRFEYPSSCE